jgi:predicted CXXCH cytochrome family protein
MFNHRILVFATGFLLFVGGASAQDAGVSKTVHNLSLSGPGTVKSASDVGVCIFCHSPHNGNPVSPMWNKQLPGDTYTQYTSSTYQQINQPVSTRSKQCLSCHDGTIALGQTVATGDLGVPAMKPESSAYLGNNLAVDHPIGFNLPARDDGEIASWLRTSPVISPDPTVQIPDGKIECISCHDPHKQDNDKTAQKFLVRDNIGGALCVDCHDPNRGVMNGWLASAHATFPSTVAIVPGGPPYGSVASNGCMSCHTSHNAPGTGARLLRSQEESACVTCHDGAGNLSPAAPNVMAVLNTSRYVHPVLTVSGAHDPAEALPVTSQRHSECADCHNPHASQSPGTLNISAPLLPAALMGVNGVSASNGTSALTPATNEYEVCFKCHANSSNKPQSTIYSDYGPNPSRNSYKNLAGTDIFNTRLQFQSTVSFHNVTQPARGNVSPSLRTTMLDLTGTPGLHSLTAGTYLYCADCHNSETARSDGGGPTGVNGPHGSKWNHILERRYEFNVPPPAPGGDYASIGYSSGSAGPYALCDKCHNVDNLVNGSSDVNFGKHREHVVNGGLSCAACHASHGVQNGSLQSNKGLLDLDISIAGSNGATPNPTIDTQTRSCNLSCHNRPHFDTAQPSVPNSVLGKY